MAIDWRAPSTLGPSNKTLVTLLIVLDVFSIFPGDAIVPSLPNIGSSLGATSNEVQLTVSIFLLASSIFQIICGFLNDKIEPKITLLVSMTIFTIGSIIAAMTNHITYLWFARFLQGLGSACFLVLARHWLKASFSKAEDVAIISSLFMISTSFTLALAPTIGGYIDHHMGWRWNFWLLGFAGICLTLLYAFALPKDQAHHNSPPKIQHMIEECKNLPFMRYVIIVGLTLAFMMTYDTMAPFILEKSLCFTPKDTGLIMATACLPILISTLFLRYLSKYFSPNQFITTGLSIMLVSTLSLLTFHAMGLFNAWVITLPYLFGVLGASFLFTNCFVGAFEHTKHRSIAIGLYGTCQFFIASMVSGLSSLTHENTVAPMAVIMLLSTLLAIIIHGTTYKKIQRILQVRAAD